MEGCPGDWAQRLLDGQDGSAIVVKAVAQRLLSDVEAWVRHKVAIQDIISALARLGAHRC